MSSCCSTKVSFGSIGEVSAALAASVVRMEESRNVRRFMPLSFHALLTMNVVHPSHGFRLRLDIRQIKVDHHRLLAAAHDHARQCQVVVRIDLLMWDEWRHVNEIARTRLRHEFEPLAPSHPGSSAHDVYYCLERAMMVRTGHGFG